MKGKKQNKPIDYKGLFLILSILFNLSLLGDYQEVKKIGESVAENNFMFISSGSLTISKNLEDIIQEISNMDGKNESKEFYELFLRLNRVYSMSEKLEVYAETIDTRYNKLIEDEILKTQHILSILNSKLYILNTKFLSKDPQNFILSTGEIETLKTIAEIYRILGSGIKTDSYIDFAPGLFDSLVEPLKKIVDTDF